MLGWGKYLNTKKIIFQKGIGVVKNKIKSQ